MEGTLRDGDLKARVLDATSIVDLIARTVSLKRAGKKLMGLCPFHQEKSPSFSVDPTKQFFYCFGCKKCGNAIDFVMERDRLEFKDALRQLAQAAGIPFQESQGGGRPGESQVLRQAHAEACMFFEKQLASPVGLAARKYLHSRGFNEESLKRFHIGFAAESWDGLMSALGRRFTPAQLALGGLVKPRDGGGHYDTFRNRVMFPIRDGEGRVIAFGGRAMPGADEATAKAKYLNSPETPLFDKGRCAFGIDLAKEKIVATRVAAIVEGYTDVVMAHQFGCSNVVSTLGTALTPKQMALLGRFADKVVLLFDPDSAGDAAVDRAVELFLTQEKVEIAVASLPDGLDPDEFLLKRGAEAFDAILAGAVDALAYKWRQLVKRFNQSNASVTGQQQAITEYLNLLEAASQSGLVDPIRWGAAVRRVSRFTEIPTAELQRRFKAASRKRRTAQVIASNRSKKDARSNGKGQENSEISRPSGRDRAEEAVLGYLLFEPGRWVDVQAKLHPDDFSPGPRRSLAEIFWQHQRDEGEPVVSHFLAMLEDPAVKETAAQLIADVSSRATPENWLDSGLEYLLSERRRAAPEREVSQLRLGGTEEEGTISLQKISESSRIPDGRRLPFKYVV